MHRIPYMEVTYTMEIHHVNICICRCDIVCFLYLDITVLCKSLNYILPSPLLSKYTSITGLDLWILRS